MTGSPFAALALTDGEGMSVVRVSAPHDTPPEEADPEDTDREDADREDTDEGPPADLVELALHDILHPESTTASPGSSGLSHHAGAPISTDNTVIGALCVIQPDAPREFSAETLAGLQALARLAEVLLPDRSSLDHPPLCRHEQVLNGTGVPVVVTDLDNEISWSTPAAGELFGTTTLQGRNANALANSLSTTAGERMVEERIAPLMEPSSGKLVGTVRTYSDITARESERSRLERLVNTESLTGVPNRRAFYRRLRSELGHKGASLQPPTALCVIDLDRFKPINDQLGHAVGDQVLVRVADATAQVLGPDDFLARLGGDEFGIIVRMDDTRSATEVAERVLDAMRQSMRLHQDVRQNLSASIGITYLKPGDQVPEVPMRRADRASYQSKQAGGDCWTVIR